jgi:hypothetical protein
MQNTVKMNFNAINYIDDKWMELGQNSVKWGSLTDTDTVQTKCSIFTLLVIRDVTRERGKT